MKAKTKLSIVIPAYNTDKYIGECLESVITQDSNEFEVIVIDDGSTDDTLRICNKIAKKSKKVRVIHTENNGVSSARNLGIRESNGEWIWFIDSDDFIKPSSISEILNNLEETDLLVFGIEEFDKSVKIERKYGNLDSSKDYTINQIISDTGIRGYPFNKIFRLDTIKKNGLRFEEPIKNCEDLLFAIRYTSNINKIRFLDKALYCYRRRRGGAIHSKINQEQSTAIDAFLNISKESLDDEATIKAKALFVKAYYKYLPILSAERKKKYKKDLHEYRQLQKSFSKKDKLLIFGYRFLNPIMRLLHTPTAKGKNLYE